MSSKQLEVQSPGLFPGPWWSCSLCSSDCLAWNVGGLEQLGQGPQGGTVNSATSMIKPGRQLCTRLMKTWFDPQLPQ